MRTNRALPLLAFAVLAVPTIAEGAPANLTLVDPNREWTIEPERLRTKSKNTPFMGQTVKGMVVATVVSGSLAFEMKAPR